MAGHSKWKNIQHRKGAQDSKRGKIFQKLAKEIFVAAKEGEPNPETNAALRQAIEKAKSQSMPKDNIERAVARAAGGQDGDNYDEIVYEGYGPNGVAIMVYCLTDNRNRTAASVRSIFTKGGGNLGADGSVSYLFNKKGEFIIDKNELTIDADEFVLEVMEFNVEDVEEQDEVIAIYCDPKYFIEVKEALDSSKYINSYLKSEVTMVPTMEIDLDEESQEKIEALVEQLEDNDDVQDVYHNRA